DQQPTAAVSLGLGEYDVGHDADAEQHEHRSACDLIEKDSAHISQTPHCSFVLVCRHTRHSQTVTAVMVLLAAGPAGPERLSAGSSEERRVGKEAASVVWKDHS